LAFILSNIRIDRINNTETHPEEVEGMNTTIENLISQTPDRLLTEKEERELTKRKEEGDRKARKKIGYT